MRKNRLTVLKDLVLSPFRKRGVPSVDETLLDTTEITQGSALKVSAFGNTDRGKVRANNEDAFLCATERGLFVVADGMGGHAAGEQASREAVETIASQLSIEALSKAAASGCEEMARLLSHACEEASRKVINLANEHPEWVGMGTTVVIAVVEGQTAHIANVGDSRAYLIRGGETELLTTDDSVAADLVAGGQISADELRSHPLRNHLTAALGMTRDGEPAPIQPHTKSVSLEPGDRILLCSDGLWDMVTDDDIKKLVSDSRDPREAVVNLINAANDAGGLDNITAIAVFVEGTESEVAASDETQGEQVTEPPSGGVASADADVRCRQEQSD